MKGFILAAGFGSRLKPWTDIHPKALVPVCGIPMLERIVNKFYSYGIDDITVNCHHFSSQIVEFIHEKGWNINIVEEIGQPLETGGAILNAAPFLEGDEPVLVHNVDILSNVDFQELREAFKISGSDAMLLVSERDSSRKLIFDNNWKLRGWHSLKSGEFKPVSFVDDPSFKEFAFSGIYIISPDLIEGMRRLGWEGKFSIIDFFLSTLNRFNFTGYLKKNLDIIDIGKPETLKLAETKCGLLP